MLSSTNPASPSPQPELLPPYARPPLSSHGSTPRGSSNHITTPDGYASPQRPVEQRGVAPSRHAQHRSLNSPQPSLSPLSEYHSGFSDADLGSPYSPASTHRRQHSFPTLVPLPFRNRTPSPTRKPSRLPEQMPYTGDGRSGGRIESPKGGFAGWFSGTAAGNALGMSAQDEDLTPDATPTRVRRSATNASTYDPSTPKSTVTATASRFMSALSSRFTPTPASPIIDDELCNMNIEAALFPPGSPSEQRDSFSPAAFKNLQMNAVGLLSKMQGAYRDRVATLRELQGEKLAQREELEEAETRARHLKMQLEGMARKAQEQEKEMLHLMEELAAERKARAEERLTAEKLILSSEGSIVSEDLGVDDDRRQRKWAARKSGDTAKSEAGFDTDEESAESESVFSRCRSPTLPVGSGPVAEGNTIDVAATSQPQSQSQQPRSSNSLAPPLRLRPGQPQPQPQPMSAFQKIIKGISGETEDSPAVHSCANCRGQNASVAWDTVSLLRDENKHLKQRVGQLEVAVEGALDLVNGIGL